MKSDRMPITALLALAFAAIVQFVYYYPRLPDRIAVHFGVHGAANNWGDKATFVMSYAAVEAALAVSMFVMARLLERIPASALNIPNREYWLAPERRRATLDYVIEQFLWFDCITLAFLVAVAQVIFVTNLKGSPPTLPRDFWIVIVAFLAGMGWISVRLVARFRLERGRRR